MHKREPAPELKKILEEIEKKAFYLLGFRKLDDSLDLYKQYLEKIIEAQEKEGRVIHKGLPIHMMGYIYKLRRKDKKALYHFLLAYIEDTLNTPINKEHEAEEFPAYYSLINGFGFDEKLLKEIAVISKETKEKEIEIFNPEKIFEQLGIDVDDLLKYSSREKNVFVGGDYLINSENITIVKKYVKDLGFNPVIPYYLFKKFQIEDKKFQIEENQQYSFSMSWLSRCKYAIFSVVHGGGHFFEIAQCERFEIKPLLLVHKFEGEDKKLKKLSDMVRSIGYDIKQYEDPFNELKDKIRKYLI